MNALIFIAGFMALVAIVFAFGALGLAAFGRETTSETTHDNESFGDRLGVALFDLANTLFISRPARALAELLPAKSKRSA